MEPGVYSIYNSVDPDQITLIWMLEYHSYALGHFFYLKFNWKDMSVLRVLTVLNNL